ncbi:unnamed protein product [Discosporangium mesarthrocarpum]
MGFLRSLLVLIAMALMISTIPLLVWQPKGLNLDNASTGVVISPPQDALFVIATLDVQKTASTLLNGLFCKALEEFNLSRGITMGGFRRAIKRYMKPPPRPRRPPQKNPPKRMFPLTKRAPEREQRRSERPYGHPHRPPLSPKERRLMGVDPRAKPLPPEEDLPLNNQNLSKAVVEPHRDFFRYYQHGRALFWSHDLCSNSYIPCLSWCPHHPDMDEAQRCIGSHFSHILSEEVTDIVYVTFLRDPVQRVVSEYHHLKGNLHSGMKGSWLLFQPHFCNGTVVDTVGEWKKEQEKKLEQGGGEWAVNGTGSTTDSSFGYRRSLQEWVEVGRANPANNRMVRHLASPYDCVSSVEDSVLDEEWMLASAMANLETKIIFGLQVGRGRNIRPVTNPDPDPDHPFLTKTCRTPNPTRTCRTCT